jgi:hypothetical protein
MPRFFVLDSRSTPSPQPSPQGARGEREPVSVCFKAGVRLEVSGRCTSKEHLGQSPLPLGEG